MKRKTLIGTSGYYNRLWKGIFYPDELAPAKWFDYYATRFNTFEINSTFYKFPTVKSLATWYNRTPDGFTFAVKAPKQITHINKFADSALLIRNFYSACVEGLQEKLGCILFQLPPSFAYSEENLGLVLSHLDPEFSNVVEFRNSSWWNEDVYEAFRDCNITFCNVSYPRLPDAPVQTTDTVYFRLHGVPRLFYSEYGDEQLMRMHNWLCTIDDWTRAYIFFNNTAAEGGIKNALLFRSVMQPGCGKF